MPLVIPDSIQAELDKIKGRWLVEPGKKHWKVKIDGRLAAILPHGRVKNASKWAERNVVADIRRAARGTFGRKQQ